MHVIDTLIGINWSLVTLTNFLKSNYTILDFPLLFLKSINPKHVNVVNQSIMLVSNCLDMATPVQYGKPNTQFLASIILVDKPLQMAGQFYKIRYLDWTLSMFILKLWQPPLIK